MEAKPYKTRQATRNDLNFILSTWLKSARNSGLNSLTPTDLYYSTQEPKLKDILSHCSTLVVCDVEDEDTIFGWIAYESNLVHYIYVKHSFRGLGLARELLQQSAITTPFQTSSVPNWSTSKIKDFYKLKGISYVAK